MCRFSFRFERLLSVAISLTTACSGADDVAEEDGGSSGAGTHAGSSGATTHGEVGGSTADTEDPSVGEVGSSGDESGGDDDGRPAGDGLPCEIDEILQSSCIACHSATPTGGALTRMLNRSDLLADALSLPGSTVAEAALARFAGMGLRMPPAPATPLAETQIAAWDAWVAAGSPIGECVSDPEPDPFDVEPTCTSENYWDDGLFEGDHEMNPGRECVACHDDPAAFGGDEDGPSLPFAGTVFPTAHEPDDCYGVDGDASDVSIVITAANGEEVVMSVDAAGNFSAEPGDLPDAFDEPWTAKVVADGAERIMMAQLESGDCNSCHTQDGAEDAPGRIILP